MDPGLKLKNIREKLGLRFRDVERASNTIAARRRSSDFAIGLSRLADIENKGVAPNLHRLYSLCAIYRLDLVEVLEWYGVPVGELWVDAAQIEPPKTHPLQMQPPTVREHGHAAPTHATHDRAPLGEAAPVSASGHGFSSRHGWRAASRTSSSVRTAPACPPSAR